MNSWMMHLKKFHKDHPELSYKECMSRAKKTYKKTKRTKTLYKAQPAYYKPIQKLSLVDLHQDR